MASRDTAVNIPHCSDHNIIDFQLRYQVSMYCAYMCIYQVILSNFVVSMKWLLVFICQKSGIRRGHMGYIVVHVCVHVNVGTVWSLICLCVRNSPLLSLDFQVGILEPKPRRDILMTDFEVVETVEFPA